ncbi:MAG: hypothetical protein ABEJ03_01370 [Candidatus Nanohaloarchaea archaeon]
MHGDSPFRYEETVKSIEKSAKIIDSTLKQFNASIKESLRERAPETTPDAEIRWGHPSYLRTSSIEPNSLENERFLLGILLGVLMDKTEFGLYHMNDLKNDNLFTLGAAFDRKAIGGSKNIPLASLEPTDKLIIYCSFVPNKVQDKIRKKLSSELEEARVGNLINKLLNELNSVTSLDSKDQNLYRATIAHEMNHYYVWDRSKLKSILLEEYNDEWQSDLSNKKLESIDDRSKIQDASAASSLFFKYPEMLSSLVNTDELLAIEEAFSFFISDQYNQNIGRSEQYNYSEEIKWCKRWIKEKYKRDCQDNLAIDWARQKNKAIFDRIAVKGKIDEEKRNRTGIFFFVNEMMLRRDKKIKKEINRIVREEVDPILEGLTDIIEKYEGKSEVNNSELRATLSELENTERFLRHIDYITTRRTIEEKADITQTHRILISEVENEIQNIKNIILKLNSNEKELGRHNVSRVEESLESVLEQLKLLNDQE